jgi:predicted AlkP superfamily pyrophosphatase or phosphodiesterase
VSDYVRSHPIQAAFNQSWTRVLPASRYFFDDDAPGEATPNGWTRIFPHNLTGERNAPDQSFVTQWERSPWSDAYLGNLAIALLTKLQLGRSAGTDMLAISFSGADLVGHQYGPRSHEVQDLLVRLDGTIGGLLDALDRSVGRDRYVLALTSDHGVSPLPEQGPRLGFEGGRIPLAEVRTKIQTSLRAFGENPIAAIVNPNVYLNPRVLDQIKADAGAKQAVTDAILGVNGMAHVYWAADLESKDSTADPILRAMRLSDVPGRSGDLVMVPKPHWMIQATGTTHGTPYPYDSHVPVVLFGGGIKPGRYDGTASPLDIAPTLAGIAGIKLPDADGRALTEALRR